MERLEQYFKEGSIYAPRRSWTDVNLGHLDLKLDVLNDYKE